MTAPSQKRPAHQRHAEEVSRALTTARLHQASIEHADAKIARLVGLHGALTALVLSSMPRPTDAWSSPAKLIASCLAGVVFLGALAAVARHLTLGFRPQTAGPGGANRFGFRDPMTPSTAPCSAPDERLEAWQLATHLADIARSKHERIRMALPWTCVSVGATALWLVATTVL